MNSLLRRHIEEIKKLCKICKVKELYVFGSVLTSQFKKESDIDMLISIDISDPLEYAENYFKFKFSIEELLNRSIDLLEIKALKNKTFRMEIDKVKVLLYEDQSKNVA